MCILERNFIIYPDGYREPHERLLHCPLGTPNSPCNRTEVVDLPHDEYALLPEAPPAPQPRYQVGEPRAPRRQPQIETVRYRKKVPDGLKVVWDFHIPFTSCSKKPRPKQRELIVVKKVPNHRPSRSPPIIHQPPPPPMAPLPAPVPPPPPPPPHGPIHGPPWIEERVPRTVEPRELAEERERRGIVERIAMEERVKRVRAEQDAENLRRQRDHERKRKSDLKRDKRHLEEEVRERAASVERERLRSAHVRARAQSRERVIRRVAEDRGRANAEAQERVRHRAEALRRLEEVEERRRAEEVAAAAAAARLRDEERDRLARLRVQRIPRRPRHQPIVHHYEPGSFEDRGDRFIYDAIIEREMREAEANRGWFR